MKNSRDFLEQIDVLDFAFQAIVNIESSEAYGVEALLRNVDRLGYETVHHFFDDAYNRELLHQVDLILREKVIGKFVRLENHASLKLFYNLDNRLLETNNYTTGNTDTLLQAYSLDKGVFCFEISERHEVVKEGGINHILEHYKNEGFGLAIDDFGIGFSGFKLLYEFTPDVIKIDRFFLKDICTDSKKRLIVKSIIALAKQLGIKIIAEGIERESELEVCKGIGCQYVQGYLIHRPSYCLDRIKRSYTTIDEVA